MRAPVTEQGRLLGGIICQARDPEACDEVTLAAHREAKTDPWEANARLIAAAPELLAAANEAFDFLGGIDGASEIRSTLLASISKATPNTPDMEKSK
ncbi:hypothetical protein [Sphingopyxis sp. 113P3]|uniref:hypothetical protein n=1 Tax=Sphingopyxis sp. (strain 113P3) TaxID=292913 RepID=UPI0011877104|nr:hypothetical protein [Sphingopyxis sp. 113P3]